MNDNDSPVMLLKNEVFEVVAASRRELAKGMVDLGPVETSVRHYCEALAALPVEEARMHAAHLHALTEEMNALEDELKQARALVHTKLADLSQHQKAHVAYRKTDGIGEKFIAPEEDENDL